MSKKILFIFFIFIILSNISCYAENKNPKNKISTELINREPVVAGQFYPADAVELKNMLNLLFAKAIPKSTDDVIAIITPHAGYIYSGIVAATSFNQIDGTKNYKTIFIIGSSHNAAFDGASIYNKGNFVTPLGIVEVDIPLANKLIKENDILRINADAHLHEHSIEVELPFLQTVMKTRYKIVPILLGTENIESIKKIAAALKPYFNSNNLFIISTDFTHYPDYKNAVDVDKQTAEAIQLNSAEQLLNSVNKNMNKGIPNLACCICGLGSVLTLLNITEEDKNISIKTLQYMNSGDISGDKSRVVGYNSIVFSKKKEVKKMAEKSEFSLTEKDKKDLLAVARKTIEQYIKYNKKPEIDSKNFSKNLIMNCGAFVTLHKQGELRGCIGRFDADIPLYKVVEEMAIASSTQDYRFPPVTADEIDKIHIEISVLSPMKKIKSIDEIILGKHGIYIKKGFRGGTFLPQVANETGWSKEEFLGHCARDKAGLSWDGWKDADIYIYTAEVFNE